MVPTGPTLPLVVVYHGRYVFTNTNKKKFWNVAGIWLFGPADFESLTGMFVWNSDFLCGVQGALGIQNDIFWA